MPTKPAAKKLEPVPDLNSILDDVVATIRAKYGKEISHRAGKEPTRSAIKETISSGFDVLDYHVIGTGLPVGRVVELAGLEGSGKSSLAYHWISQAQRMGGAGILGEVEQALTRPWAERQGIVYDDLILNEPDTLEVATDSLLDSIYAFPPRFGPIIAVLDSIAAPPTARELEEGLTGKDKMSDRAKGLAKFCRFLPKVCRERRVCIILINQLRDKMGVSFGGETMQTVGGHSVRFASSLRLQLMGGKAVKDEQGLHIAKDVVAIAVKNRMAPPWRKARIRLDYATGWDNQWSTVNFAKEIGVLKGRSPVNEKTYREAMEALEWAATIAA
jgi:recombination protein RecA